MTNKDTSWIEKRVYSEGFESPVPTFSLPPGLNAKVVAQISEINQEPAWMRAFRLQAYEAWTHMTCPTWAKFRLQPIDFQSISYLARPAKPYQSWEEVDPEIKKAFEKLGVPLAERARLAGVAMDAVFDSVSVLTTFQAQLQEKGIVFCSMNEAIRNHPDLVQRYLSSVVPIKDNFFATLNSAVFSDGSFVWIPPHTQCPMDLSTYFRMNAKGTGQFERTLIICEEGAEVSYLEGCSAPMRSEYPLHAAVVELIAQRHAKIHYSTVQNWYPGNEQGEGGVYNFVTKRGDCRGDDSQISWTQVETGSAITWKYPSCMLRGKRSHGTFNSVALTTHFQQADTGTKMLHFAPDTRSHIVSKTICLGHSSNRYRGQVKMTSSATHAKNYTRCDSLIIGSQAAAHTYPSIEVQSPTSSVEHEATTSKISEDQLFYCRTRGLNEEESVSLILSGFCQEVFQGLPMEFAVEAKKLLSLQLEGAIG